MVYPTPPDLSAFQNSKNKMSRSAHELDSLAHEDRHKSSSLQHLENNNRSQHHLRNRNLHNIHENLSATENDNSDGDLRDVSVMSDVKTKQKNHKHASPSRGSTHKLNTRTINAVQNNNNNNSSFDEDENEIPFEKKRHLFEESYRRAQQNQQQRSSSKSRDTSRERSPGFIQKQTQQYEHKVIRREHDDYKKPPPGPPKPARTIDRRRLMSR